MLGQIGVIFILIWKFLASHEQHMFQVVAQALYSQTVQYNSI